MQGGHSPGKQGNQGKVRGGDFFDEKVRDIYEKLSGKNENVLTNALRKCWHPAFSFHIFSKDMSYQCYVLLYCWQIGVGGGGGHSSQGKYVFNDCAFFPCSKDSWSWLRRTSSSVCVTSQTASSRSSCPRIMNGTSGGTPSKCCRPNVGSCFIHHFLIDKSIRVLFQHWRPHSTR